MFAVARFDDGDLVLAREREEFLAIETAITRFDRVAQRSTLELRRQQVEKCRDLLRVERLRLVDLPVDRPELVAEIREPACEEPLDARSLRRRENLAQHDESRRLDAEDEAIRRFVVPLLERRGLLQSVERRVDLDRCELAAGVVELFRLGHALRVERAAPRREVPAADADENLP